MTFEYDGVPGLVAATVARDTGVTLEICIVPNDRHFVKGTKIIVESGSAELNAVCETDALFTDREGYDFIRAIWEKDFLPIKARYIIERFDEPKGG